MTTAKASRTTNDARRRPPAPSDPEGRVVTTASGDLHLVEEGPVDGPVALLVHGVPGSTRDWRYLGPALAAYGVRAVRVDLPGFGRSAAKAATPSVEGLARAVLDVAGALRCARFAVVGHSFGGPVGLALAAHAPASAAALVLVNSPGPVRHRGYSLPSRGHRALARALEAPVVGDPLAAGLRRAYAAFGLKSDAPLDRERLAYQARLVGSLDFLAMRRRLRALSCPVLVVSSDDDALVEPFVARAIVRALPTRVLRSHVHVQGGGHFLQKHRAPEIAEWVADRLAASTR